MHLDEAPAGQVRDILRRHLPAGTTVLVFGSRAHGRNVKPYSDLDLCLRGTKALPTGLIEALETAFRESDLPIKVDVVDWHRLPPEFRDAIAADLAPFPLEPGADNL
jgi:predicted nucleotidyltransferase